MKNSLTSLCLGSAIFFFGSLISCTSEAPTLPNDDAKEATLTIIVPRLVNTTPDAETRASFGVDATDEAAIDDLWIYGFAVEGSSGNDFNAKNIKASETSVGTTTYKTYSAEGVRIGKYRIYLLANLSDYITDTGLKSSYNAGTLTENQIEKLVLNFSTTKIPTKGHLPMACYKDEVKTGEDNSTKVTSGEFDFDTNKTLYADMTLLCSKVRYTILFDNTSDDYSKKFGNVLVDFNVTDGTSAKNVVSQVAYKTGTATSTPFEYTGLDLARVAYPTSTAGQLYLDIAENKTLNLGNEVTLANLGDPSTTWENDGQRAWQGVVYLPENPNGTTSIHFTPETSAVDETKTFFNLNWNSKGIERGHFYEVVAVIKDPKTIAVTVKVKVNDWQYESHTTTW
ncbi:MAG: hypothetical protein J1D77_05675 [Muribaculaceae bacterium]|nr:hypothetical protein [Muribaculaceae bacterium]